MYVLFLQAEVPSNVETVVASDIQFPVEVTGAHMRPVVVLEQLDLTRYTNSSVLHYEPI